ncbi:phosphatase PAP2 family protein [Massilia aurea]|uniref:phosphatase PAP2 family protein n=1 Tax=Massilia aurea TaxID=373040 RepID=UPI002163863C|nr:phosphatase PAP2 family protein [Massilia aurea]MCS0707043.1 phosphatase PAP2 family protein [Massilia aurea]
MHEMREMLEMRELHQMRAEPGLHAPLLSAHALRRLAMMLAAGALTILWLGRYTDLDLVLADAVFDVERRVFPWRDTWLTVTFNHVIVKQLLMLLAVGVVGYALVDAWRPRAALGALGRVQLRIVALAAILVPAVTSTLKHLSASHCPWDLLRYGGEQPYVRLFGAFPADTLPGQCLPAGHASSALWLVALAVCWLPARPSRARAAALLAIGAGATVGYLQQLRGAHFMTHTLWSIWIACTIVVALIATLQGRPS